MANFEYKVLPLSKLIPAGYNPRQITDKDYKALMRSMKEFGVVEPLVVQEKLISVPEYEEKGHRIIGGHQRYNAACGLKLGEVPCIILDIDDTKAKLLNLALNSIHGSFVPEKLNAILDELRLEGADISLTGIEDIELEPVEPIEPDTGEETSMLTCPECGYEWEDFAGKAKENKRLRKLYESNKPKYKARFAVTTALRSGKIVKPEQCCKCQKVTSKLEAHHEDYDKPLEIMWMCRTCHVKHEKLKEG